LFLLLIVRVVVLLDLYTAFQVHLIPDYPSNASDSLLVAFYVQQPLGQFIGNVSVLPSDTLLDIVLNNTVELEAAIGARILRVEVLFKPTTSPTKAKPVEPTSNNDNWKWIGIGVGAGLVIILLILLLW